MSKKIAVEEFFQCGDCGHKLLLTMTGQKFCYNCGSQNLTVDREEYELPGSWLEQLGESLVTILRSMMSDWRRPIALLGYALTFPMWGFLFGSFYCITWWIAFATRSAWMEDQVRKVVVQTLKAPRRLWGNPRRHITHESRELAAYIVANCDGGELLKLTEDALSELPLEELRALRARIDKVLEQKGEKPKLERKPSCLYITADGESTLVPFDI